MTWVIFIVSFNTFAFELLYLPWIFFWKTFICALLLLPFFLLLLHHSFLLIYHHLHQLNVPNQCSMKLHTWLPLSFLNLSYIFIYVFGVVTLFNALFPLPLNFYSTLIFPISIILSLFSLDIKIFKEREHWLTLSQVTTNIGCLFMCSLLQCLEPNLRLTHAKYVPYHWIDPSSNTSIYGMWSK